jgi:nitric oxide dioxygenase
MTSRMQEVSQKDKKESVMNKESVLLVQESFRKVAPIADAAAKIFYTRLFTIEPPLRALFKGDLSEQGRMLMAALGMAVNGLSQPETIAKTVRDLGVRHRGYGVKEEHYKIVGEALIFTLETGLGPAFNDSLRQAWLEAYALLSGLMIEASKSEA